MRFLLLFLLSFFQFVGYGSAQIIANESNDKGTISAPATARDGVKDVGQYAVGKLPNPKREGQGYFVSNPDGILSRSTVEYLNKQIQDLESHISAEIAVVVVNDYHGSDDFSFALTLFNEWGIGKEEKNNGLLLFIAKDRRKYRFISGYGVEAILPDATLKRIGETYLVPNFRKDDYDKGVIEAIDVIIKVLDSSDGTEVLEKELRWQRIKGDILALFNIYTISLLLFILLYTYVHFITKRLLVGQNIETSTYGSILTGCGCMGGSLFGLFIVLSLMKVSSSVFSLNNLPYFLIIQYLVWLTIKLKEGYKKIDRSFVDSQGKYEAFKKYLILSFVPMLLVPFSWFDFKSIYKLLRRDKDRFIPPDDSGNWERLIRGKGKMDVDILNSGQQKEEELGSMQYEIWKNTLDGEILLVPWQISQNFGACPKCGYYTYQMYLSRVIRAATYSSSGEGETYSECENCFYRKHLSFYAINRLRESSSSSSYDSSSSSGGSSYSGGSGGSSSSSSSGSSSGSFGGGSSGGGGAGGSW